MPKSKRDKQVHLTKTKKQHTKRVSALREKIQEYLDKFDQVFVLSAKNLQNAILGEIRESWIHSKLVFGKKTVMSHALGRSRETEYKRNLFKLSARLYGHTGLLFTNSTEDEVLEWFSNFKKSTFACAGDKATETVVLEAGDQKVFGSDAHTEEYLRNILKLPTEFQAGVVILKKDFTVCEEGEELTSTQAKILKLLDRKMYEFKVTVECMWSNTKFKAYTVATDIPSKYKAKTDEDGDNEDDVNDEEEMSDDEIDDDDENNEDNSDN